MIVLFAAFFICWVSYFIVVAIVTFTENESTVLAGDTG